MNITILANLEGEDSEHYDPVADQVAEALRQGRHKPSILAVYGDQRKLVNGLRRRQPDLVFNLTDFFGASRRGAVAVAGLLDLMGLRYTGGGPGELFLREDKSLAKKILAFEKILYPDFAVFSSHDMETDGRLRLPLFVKPLRTDASAGISAKSLVRDYASLTKQVRSIQEKFGGAALAEEYIEGREFYVGVLGNHNSQAFPPIEMDFSGLPEGTPAVLDFKAKWARNSPEFRGTKAVLAEVPDELRAKLQQVSLAAYRALRVRDYGRIDLRLTEAGDVYVIEVNANCFLERSGEFASAAAAAGIDYPTLINRIVDLALERYQLGI